MWVSGGEWEVVAMGNVGHRADRLNTPRVWEGRRRNEVGRDFEPQEWVVLGGFQATGHLGFMTA
jgi:hypothetical protein